MVESWIGFGILFFLINKITTTTTATIAIAAMQETTIKTIVNVDKLFFDSSLFLLSSSDGSSVGENGGGEGVGNAHIFPRCISYGKPSKPDVSGLKF